jgi:SPP1 family phage portal protein
MFYINRDSELDTKLLEKLMNKFTTYVQPNLKRWKNYYDGKHDILHKTYSDPSKPCSKIVTNFCKIVTDTYSGYICGKPVSYTSNDNIEDVQEVINYNDDNANNIQMCTNALIYGVAYELQWLDKNAQVRYSQVDPLNAFAVYDNSIDSELLYFVRWYDADSVSDDETSYVEVYSADMKRVYKIRGIGGSLTLESEEPHFFGDVPVSVFYLNDNEESIFAQAISQQDAYNELQSSEVDDYSAFCDAYLTLTGMDATTEDIADMKKNRVLIFPEGGSGNYLTKQVNDAQIANMLENIKKNIFKVCSAPDLGDENFMAQSGVAIQYKLTGFENSASGIVARFTKAIQRRIELICNVLNLKASDAVWRDIKINFVRNLPVNYGEMIQLVQGLQGVVSNKTLLGQLGFIDDIDSELEAIKKQKEENMNLYAGGFGHFNHLEDEEEDDAL